MRKYYSLHDSTHANTKVIRDRVWHEYIKALYLKSSKKGRKILLQRFKFCFLYELDNPSWARQYIKKF